MLDAFARFRGEKKECKFIIVTGERVAPIDNTIVAVFMPTGLCGQHAPPPGHGTSTTETASGRVGRVRVGENHVEVAGREVHLIARKGEMARRYASKHQGARTAHHQ